MNANACEVAKPTERWEEEIGDVFGIKLDGRGSPDGARQGCAFSTPQPSRRPGFINRTLLANRFHSNPIPQLYIHLVVDVLKSNSAMLTPP